MRRLSLLIRVCIFTALSTLATGKLFAQEAPATSTGPAPDLTEIIVTGSRIAAPNEVSTSPIQVLDSSYITASGRTDIADLIQLLPQNYNNALGQDLGNGTSGLSDAGGVATADLRGLGPNRTLVLVDGRRLGQGSPYTFIASPAPDLDQIPAGLVDRVEVVTGGASAAYGSDAIAGVVNFIMKKNFEGVQFDSQYTENYHNNDNTFAQQQVAAFGSIPSTGTIQDGRTRNFDLLMGTNFADGQGNITAYLSYRHADPVASASRDYGGCEFGPNFNAAGAVSGVSCTGSSNSNFFQPTSGPNALNAYSVGPGNVFVPNGTPGTTPPGSYNSESDIYLTREDDRYNAAILAHQTINDYVKPYAEVYFMDDRTTTNIAPAALFKDSNPFDPVTNNYNVNCNNPFLSAQEQGTICTPAQIAAAAAAPDAGCSTTAAGVLSANCTNVRIGRRNLEGGDRIQNYEHENYRVVIGDQGSFLDAWKYDVYGQYYYTNFIQSSNKYLGFQEIDNALQVTGTAAAPVCVSGPPCVPYNIFQNGGVSQAALNYLYESGTGQGTSTLRTEHAEITGELGHYGIKSPFSTEGIGIDVGYEHRNDNEYFQPDSAELSGNLSGFGSAATALNSTISVSEEFAELRAPLVEDQPFAKQLLFDTGFRHSDYAYVSTASTITNTYKFEVQYAPVADYRLRASYDKAIRAPSAIELYNPQLVGLFAYGNDPCAPTVNGGVLAPATYSLAQCERTGVTAAQYGNGGTTNSVPQGTAGQLSQLTGGNPELKPEQAETYTFGVNFAPSQIPHLTGSLDYYHIQLTNSVSVLPASVIVSDCANTGNPLYCSQIVRNRNTGSLTGASIASGGYIVQGNVNIGAALVSGIDAQVSYKWELPPGFGNLSWDLNGAYLSHMKSTPYVGAHTYDCAGLFGYTCQTVNPRWHHLFRTTWNTPWNASLAATWRYIGRVTEDNNTGDPTLQNSTYGAYDGYNGSIKSYSYLDLQATYNVYKGIQLRAGVNNVLDKDPPIINDYIAPGGSTTYPTYDEFGRVIYVAFTAKF